MAKSAKEQPPKAAVPKNGKAPDAAMHGDRYLRAARAIIASGEGDSIDPMRLVADAQLSEAAARYCIAAYRGVTQALREAKLLPEKPAPSAKAPVAPKPHAGPVVGRAPTKAESIAISKTDRTKPPTEKATVAPAPKPEPAKPGLVKGQKAAEPKPAQPAKVP